jgi:hypothetical protein
MMGGRFLSDRQVLVIGVSREVNRAVTKSLRHRGIAAQGCAQPEIATKLFDARDFELIAFGRATAGHAADAIKKIFEMRRPGILLIDVIGPFAVRQVVAALRHDPRVSRFISQLRVVTGQGGATVLVQILGPCRVIFTLFHGQTDILRRRQVAEVEATTGLLELHIPGAEMCEAYSLVVDANGVEFLHHPFV